MPAPIPADSSQVRPTRARRARRALPVVVLALWTTFVACASYQWINYAPPSDQPPAVRVGLSLFFLAGPLWVLALRLRGLRQPLPPSFTASVVLTAGVAVFLAWLAQDDATWRHPEQPAALRNDFPGAAATHALVLRYGENAPGSLSATLPRNKLGFPATERSLKNDAQWTEFLGKNRPEIDRLWAECASLRAWFDELDAAPALGDLTDRIDSPLLGFRSFRLAGQTACARALQLAAEGRRDEAVETLLPLLSVAQKLEPHARTLVRRMISVVLRRQAQNTLGRVLDSGEVSPATRERIVQLLASAPDAAEQARLLALSEYGILGPMLIELRPEQADVVLEESSSLRPFVGLVLRPLIPLFYNPVRSANLAGDHLVALGEAAAHRDLKTAAALGEAQFTGLKVTLPGKNYIGRMLTAMAVPAFEKVIESRWKAEDERVALLARLESPRR